MWKLLRTQDSLGVVRYYAKTPWWNFWTITHLLGYNEENIEIYRDIIANYNKKVLVKEYV